MSDTNPVVWAERQLTKNIEAALDGLSAAEYRAYTVHGRDTLSVAPLGNFPSGVSEEWALEAEEAYALALETWRRWG